MKNIWQFTVRHVISYNPYDPGLCVVFSYVKKNWRDTHNLKRCEHWQSISMKLVIYLSRFTKKAKESGFVQKKM